MSLNLPFTDADGGLISNHTNGTEINDSTENEEGPNVAIIILNIILCSIGLFGNATVILVIVILKEYKRKKSITNW